ncbi:MAG TPA: hypothetical protein VJ747_06405 [Stellaceae bacterium]|nr:hypothetical protein [Stellaceae bacterium]
MADSSYSRLNLPANPTRRRLAEQLSWLSLVLLGLVLAFVLITTIRAPLKDDIAWLLHIAQDMLRGKRLYIDDIEINPPLVIWLLLPPAELARLTGQSATLFAELFFSAAIIGCAYWSARLLRGYSALFTRWPPVFTAIGIVLLIIPGVEFGQREHLLIAGALPYLCLVAQRLRGRPPIAVQALGCGVLAAVGCALKPHYAIAFLGIEALVAMRGLRPWRMEVICMGVLLLAYVAAVLLLFPVYLHVIIPLALDLYGASDVTLGVLVLQSRTLLLGLAVVLLLLLRRNGWVRRDPLFVVLAVFACGATVACFAEGKDWFYHRLPATITVVLALIYWTAVTLADRTSLNRRKVAALTVAACALGAFAGAAADRLTPRLELALGESTALESRIETLIKHSGARRYMAFSQSLSPGFPVVDQVGVVWTSRFDSMWALRGALWYLGQGNGASPWSVAHWIVTDFVQGCPDLVVVDDRDGLDYIRVLSAMPDFAAAWSHYRPITAFDGIRAFKLDGEPSAACARATKRPSH